MATKWAIETATQFWYHSTLKQDIYFSIIPIQFLGWRPLEVARRLHIWLCLFWAWLNLASNIWMNAYVNVSAHVHRMPTTTSMKVFVLTKNSYTLSLMKNIAYTDHTNFQSQAPPLCFYFCFLPASHCFYYCPSNLSCMFKSQNWVEYFLLSFSKHNGETSFLIKPRMGMYVEFL